MKMEEGYDFDERNEQAEKANKIVINYLNNQEDTLEVKDVSKLEEYQTKDIDIILFKKNGEIKKIEVKADEKMHETGNFFLETVSNHLKNTPGCFVYSEADEFYYYDMKLDILYIFNLNLAREWFDQNSHKFREVSASTNLKGSILYRTIGRIVPIDTFMDNVNVLVIKDIKKNS